MPTSSESLGVDSAGDKSDSSSSSCSTAFSPPPPGAALDSRCEGASAAEAGVAADLVAELSF